MGQFPEPLKTSQDCRLGGSQLQLKFPEQVSVQDLHTPQHQTLHKVLTARIPFYFCEVGRLECIMFLLLF